MSNSDLLLVGYRILERGPSTSGEVVRYSLTPPSATDSHRVKGMEQIHVRLKPGVHVATSAAGEQLLYNPPHVYGKRLSEGLVLGWCKLVDPEAE